MQQIYTHSYFKKRELYNLSKLNSLINHPKYEEISRKLNIINFYDKYGISATREAYGVGRSTIYLWKKKIKENGGDIRVLASLSRAPKNRKRESKRDKRIEEYIIRYREIYGRVGKVTIKKELDEYCRVNSIKLISETTIGRIIKDLKVRGLIMDDKVKVRFDGRTGKIRVLNRVRKKKERRKGYMPQLAGDLVQIDSMVIFEEGIKRYIVSAIDVSSRFGFSMMYDRLTSSNVRDFMKRLEEVSPFRIKRVQTDNGSEFRGEFERYVKERGIIHYYNYPRHPQSNGCVERFPRT